MVDVQNTRSQTVLTREKLDTLPNGKFMASYAAIILGASMSSTSGQDVAGNKGESTLSAFTVHGSSSNDSRYSQEGMIAAAWPPVAMKSVSVPSSRCTRRAIASTAPANQ